MGFGFGKKDKNGGSDGGRDSPSGSSRGGGNPYANAGGNNDPYMSSSGPPPPYNGGSSRSSGYPSEKTGVPPGGYGNGPRPQDNRFGAPPASDNRFGAAPGGNRFGAPPGGNRSGGDRAGASEDSNGSGQQSNRFGASGGNYGDSNRYGQDRFGASNGAQSGGGSRYGAGGYGGFGDGGSGTNSAARNELFAGAQPRNGGGGTFSGSNGYGSGGYGDEPSRRGPSDWESGRGANYGQQSDYGAYESRQLTAEEQEEEDVNSTKQEIRFIKQQDVASTRNALRMAAMAEETGRQTLERLGAQGEMIHNTERNLDLASNQNRLAAEKARELKTLNRSMFAVHVNNPFTSGKRIKEREQKVLDDARRDRDERDATRAAAWGSSARQQEVGRELNRAGGIGSKTKSSLAERSKYQFEADSEDEQMEDEIDDNLDQLHGAAKRLNHLAGAMGREVESQNSHLERIGGKVDRVDDEIALNRSRIDRIK